MTTLVIPPATPLFRGIPRNELMQLLESMGAYNRRLLCGQTLVRCGARARSIGVLVTGRLQIYEPQMDGSRAIIGEVSSGESFALAFAMAENQESLGTIVAKEDSLVLAIPRESILPVIGRPLCDARHRFLQNLMREICVRSMELRQKLLVVTRRTTAERLMAYLTHLMERNHSRTFDIPLDRQGLADYLNVERSALSAVMSGLAKKGVIRYSKNHFVLL